MKMITVLLLLSACFHTNESQKISVLQKKLETAEKECGRAKEELEKISNEIKETQLTLIRSKIDQYEKNEKGEFLFLEEREVLYNIIQAGPSPAAVAAQVELDRILRIITEVSDNV